MYDGRIAPAGGFAAAGFAQVWTTFTNLTMSTTGTGGLDHVIMEDASVEAGRSGLVTWLVMSIDVRPQANQRIDDRTLIF